MKGQIRMAVLAVAVTLALGSLAAAGDDYYGRGNYSQAQQYGYQNGYRDGVSRGRSAGSWAGFRDPDSRDMLRGYQPWMGPSELFRSAYRDGYRQGFEQSCRRDDRDYRYGDDRYRDVQWGGGPIYRNQGGSAYRYGYQDGIEVGRSDYERHKDFNPRPRGNNHADRGYRPEFGDIHSYKDQYSDGYRAGYESSYGRYGRY